MKKLIQTNLEDVIVHTVELYKDGKISEEEYDDWARAICRAIYTNHKKGA